MSSMAHRTGFVTPPLETREDLSVSKSPIMSMHTDAPAPAKTSNGSILGYGGSAAGQMSYGSFNTSEAQPSEPAQSGQTTASDAGSSIIPVTPLDSTAVKRPASPDEYFTAAGRPARSVSLKKVRYAIDWDKEGNPIKTKEEKAAEKERNRQKKEQEKQKQMEEKTVKRSRSASGSKSSVESRGASGDPSSSKSQSASNSVSSSASVARSSSASAFSKPAETTRSGRQVTAPIDRHRSAAREAKSSARRRQLQEMQSRNNQEDEQDSQGEVEADDEDTAKVQSPSAVPNGNAGPRVDAVSIHGGDDDKDEMDLLEMTDEEDALPTSASRETGKNSGMAALVKTTTTAAQRADDGIAQVSPPGPSGPPQPPNMATAPNNGDSAVISAPNRQTPGQKSQEVPLANSSSQGASIHQDSSIRSVVSRDEAPAVLRRGLLREENIYLPVPQPYTIETPAGFVSVGNIAEVRTSDLKSATPANPALSSTSPANEKDMARKAFSGKALSSLLSSTSHRRPGLGSRSVIPPLHPNRQPAPPPKMAPPMSRKEKDALKKEQRAREENGSEEDESGDEEGKPKYNPFEEEIEGY